MSYSLPVTNRPRHPKLHRFLHSRPYRIDSLTKQPITLTWPDDHPWIPTTRQQARKLYESKRGISPWGPRILLIRRVTGWTQRQLAIISGIYRRTVEQLESGALKHYHPTLATIKKIRLIEAAYADEIALYKTNPLKYERLASRRKPNGSRGGNPRVRPKLPPLGPPRDEAFIIALGGMATFSCLESKTKRPEWWPKSWYQDKWGRTERDYKQLHQDFPSYISEMSLPIYVDAHSGYRANERPIRFWLDATFNENELTGVYEIETVEDRWYDPSAEYFKVRTPEGKRYILRYDEREDQWTLQSGFDGGELLAKTRY